MNQWAKALFHKGSTPLLNYIMEWVLLATGIAGHISSVCSLPKVLFVDVRSHFVLFLCSRSQAVISPKVSSIGRG